MWEWFCQTGAKMQPLPKNYHPFSHPKLFLPPVQLTPEQEAIIAATGNLRINAVAGSGKTTTLIEYARSRPPHHRILYLAFNRSVKLEAQRKFAGAGLTNVKVETAHSLAYRYTVHKHGYTVKGDGYKIYDLAELLGIANPKDMAAAYTLAAHVARFAAFFCNSAADKVQQLRYGNEIKEEKARQFVENFYPVIENTTRRFLKTMNDGEAEVTPDFYLKKFQLSKPVLPYDVILFDEAQDASPAMTDVFLRQPATLVMVGDPHQQIYSWRYAVNALDSADFPVYPLSASFRFPPPVARLAVAALDLKKMTGEHRPVVINGRGTLRQGQDEKASKAVIARTNLGLLLKAIEHITGANKAWPVYFEGNIHSYTYADEGASLWDVLNLYNGRREGIRDKLIKSFNSFFELEDYIEKAEDASLGMLVKIVKEYGNRLPGLIASLKEKHVGNEERHTAKIIFSTVHRCKGMEYDEVELAPDFITEEKIEKAKKQKEKVEEKAKGEKASDWNPARLNEEINLLYVAVTRAKVKLVIPEEIMIKNFPPFDCIDVLKPPEPVRVSNPYLDYAELRNKLKEKRPKRTAEEKAYAVEKIRETHGGAYGPWTTEADEELRRLFKNGLSKDDLCERFGRTQGGILSRLKKLGLV